MVIGNSVYAGLPPLPACAASVNVVSAALKRAGFDVTEGLNISNGRMGAAITDFGDAVAQAPGSIAVTYVCGYVVDFDGRVFLMPASANLERPTDALTQGVVGRLLVNSVLNSGAQAGLILLDAVGQPARRDPVKMETLINPAVMSTSGFVGAFSLTTLPTGATPLAASIASAFAAPGVEAGDFVREIRDTFLGNQGTVVVAQAPSSPAWLKGQPSAPPAAVAALPAQSRIAPPQLPQQPPSVLTPVPPAVAEPPARPSIELAVLNEADKRRIQLALQRLGYYAGRVDGVIAGESLAAIRRYQHELGAALTGRLTTDQAARLLADSK